MRHWLRAAAVAGRHGVQAACAPAWAAPVTRVVLPALLASRLMVLAVGYLGVALIGYPDKSRRRSASRTTSWSTCRCAGTPAGISASRSNGYDYDPHAPGDARSRTSRSSRPIRWRCAAVTAWLGGRVVRPDEPMSGNRVEWQYAMHRRALAAGLLVSIGAFGWGARLPVPPGPRARRRRGRRGGRRDPGLRVAVRAVLQRRLHRGPVLPRRGRRVVPPARAPVGRPPSPGA